MTYAFNPIIILFTAWVLLIPAGLILAVVKRKRKGLLALGIVLLAVGIPPCFIMGPFYLWQFDALRGWDLRLSAEISPYTVTLVQEPGGDFYNSYFEITRCDGKIAVVWIDGDDSRWWNPDVVRKDGKTYFVRGFGEIGDRTSYIDPGNDIVYSGYYQQTNRISELEFKESQNKSVNHYGSPAADGG